MYADFKKQKSFFLRVHHQADSSQNRSFSFKNDKGIHESSCIALNTLNDAAHTGLLSSAHIFTTMYSFHFCTFGFLVMLF